MSYEANVAQVLQAQWKKLGVDGVFTAASGNEALKILKEESPEIMVTDIQMTEMTGLELIKAARESVPELRVIVLTGFDNFEYARESLRLQCIQKQIKRCSCIFSRKIFSLILSRK